MITPSSRRTVQLIDARDSEHKLVLADVYRDFPSAELEHIETIWEQARDMAVVEGPAGGLTPFEHAHWDWRNKVHSVEAGRHMLVSVECDGQVQGLMAVLRLPQRSRRSDDPLIYVDYLEAAPWNLRMLSVTPRFLGVGTVLMADAVRLSLDTGLEGRVGLHSLPQAEGFYQSRCGMTGLGPDSNYFDLTYFESTGPEAVEWLAAIGGV